MTLQAVVGLGANLGDRLATLRRAAAELRRVATLERASHVYESASVGPAQPDFLNAAVLLTHSGGAEALLDDLLSIEARLGRVRRERWGPRLIDLDLLWAGATLVRTPRLVVPHPHLRERAFAVLPLLDVVPDAVDPETGQPYLVPAGDVRKTEWPLIDPGPP